MLTAVARRVFRKSGPATDLPMFEAEAEGLRELAAAEAVRVPEVLAVGTDEHGAFIEMERLELAVPDPSCETRFGAQLAALHRETAERYGWQRDNFIGATPQHNPPHDDWVAFYRDHRLGFQLALAAEGGYGGELQERGARLVERLAGFFGDDVAPSLLHGDLWGGNWGMVDGHPVVFDPAVYYGDRETDLAMTRLFGGFGRAFYSAYEEAWPMAPGWQERVPLYQLYHVLNHLNLFGSSYHGRALHLLRQLT